ncbi:aminoglycoside N(3)-acetyltransferase [Streptomyces sp. NPDC012888]|uniref:aminoglycoside N(3)-acetyltransferase n=1 Tax=Streptomyces sp. NPDC012888 TaxID=3364855 RepID=UPI00367CF0C4
MTGPLARQLRQAGVRPGGRLLVHAGLSGTGLRAGELRDALLEALGPGGTLLVPAFTPENSRTSSAHLARIRGMDAEQVRAYREAMPAFDPARTASQGMGVLAETVRRSPGAARSAHPQSSFAALGRDAGRLCAGHALTCHLGEESPLGALWREGPGMAQVLMINVGFPVCTAFHLAEYRIPGPPLRMYACVVNLPGSGGDQWTEYEDVALDDGDFDMIGKEFPESGVSRGWVGRARTTLFSLHDAVDHALTWMTENRR